MGEGKSSTSPCLCAPLERGMEAADGGCAQHTQIQTDFFFLAF